MSHVTCQTGCQLAKTEHFKPQPKCYNNLLNQSVQYVIKVKSKVQGPAFFIWFH